MKKITISNSSGRYYELYYRMPGEGVQLLTVCIQSYALNNEIMFPSEEHYKQFKIQNGHYFMGNTPILIEGQVSGNKIEKINKVLEKEMQDKIESEVKEEIKKISDISEDSIGKKVEVEVEKVEKVKKTGKENKYRRK